MTSPTHPPASHLRSLDPNRFPPPDLPPGIPTGQPSRRPETELYINRELSALAYNARILEVAADPSVPLFERLKFLAFFSQNLDEFFMVRVAGLKAQAAADVQELTPDGLSPREQLQAISRQVKALAIEKHRIWEQDIAPALRSVGRALAAPDELAAEQQAALDEQFDRAIYSVLTPIAIDPAHPFPHVRNRAITVGIVFQRELDSPVLDLGVVQAPTTLPRLIPVQLATAQSAYVPLEHVILRNRAKIFPRTRITGQFAFRVTRDFDIELDEDEGEDLLVTLQSELRRREQSRAVRLQITSDAPQHAIDLLCRELGLEPEQDVYRVDGPLVLQDMVELTARGEAPELRDPPFVPQHVPPLRDSQDFFATIREQDVLLHHPYESFEPVVDFVTQAAEDPQVLAIKQTLYRTGGESPLVQALQRAAENGKQVTVVVELKARFDEQSNIQWARALERSGVNVMYGLLGLKTHAKLLLVVRKESQGLRRYVHLSTGDYNQQTARIYDDLSLFTAREDFGEDASLLFNLLTGYSPPPRLSRLAIGPLGLREAVIGLIQREAEHARAGRPAAIVAKVNSIVDVEVITALCEACEAGVRIELLVRGICCLRPGVAGGSEGLVVRAVVDRFLEHARILHFANAGQEEVYCCSADWMSRSLWRRVEVLFPIVDEALKRRVIDEILGMTRADNASAWLLGSDAQYRRVRPAPGQALVRSQQQFIDLARQRGARRPSRALARGAGGGGLPRSPADPDPRA